MNEKKKSASLFLGIEERILAFWRENKIFEESLKRRQSGEQFVFYEGPPYANGTPGIHHVETRSFKDVVARYKTMRGYYVPRQAGWDTHGLPTEIAAEKTLGVKSKRDIEEKIGIEAFVKAARENVFLYKAEWEKMTTRMGYWLDMDHPYVTMDNYYIESLWAIVKKIHERGLLYEADKVLPWCLRCGTALSFHELAQGYKTITDKAITVKFEIRNSKHETKSKFQNPNSKLYLLAWTTTPWTLPGNVALAVNPDAEYVVVESLGGPTAKKLSDRFIVAKNFAERLFPHINILETKNGSELVGFTYEPLYEIAMSNEEREKAYRVVAGDFVSMEEGTGIVHIAPAFGVDDMRVGQENHLPILRTVNEDGTFREETSQWRGENIWHANEKIIEDLKARGLLLKEENCEHDYPFCWRCDSKVIYFAKPSWWIKMSALRDQLVRENQTIHWYPPYLRDGRFGEWLREAKDWAFSRERYWGTPLPVWQCVACHGRDVLGSLDDLQNRGVRSGNRYIIIRHGEAENNVKNIINNSLSTNHYSLTERGREQVRASAEHFRAKGIKPDMIFSSPFLRTKETAAMIAEILGVAENNVKVEPRIGEIDTGIFDGKPLQEYRAFFSGLSEKFTKAPPNGGETVRDISRRALAALSEMEKRYHNKTIIIVAHEYICWALWMVARGATNEEAIAEKTKRGDDFLSTACFEEIDFMPIPRDDAGMLDMHKPSIDSIVLRCSACGELMHRVPEVIDVWFDSGAMPFASRHWPFRKEKIPYPADFICEAIDQTRGWFYTLLAVGVLLERGTPYKNVISLGLVLDKDGKKMSKSRGNVVDPWQLFEKYGADAVRWYFFTINQPWDEKRFAEKDVADVSRRFLVILWNCFQFWKMYEHDDIGGQRSEVGERRVNPPAPKLLINRWILARLDELIAGVTRKMDSYDIVGAARDIEQFVVEDFSRWYIRRIRDVIKNEAENPEGQETAKTLRVVLLETSKLLAPFVPFIAEELYRELGGSEESVHWEDWPAPSQIDANLLSSMSLVRSFASMALMRRSEENIKVRQPLRRFSIKHDGKAPEYWDELKEILKDEINVKEIMLEKGKGPDSPPFELDTTITAELQEEGTIRDVVRAIQAKRKEAGLKPGTLANISITAPADIVRIVEKHRDAITRDTNTRAITTAAGELLAIQVI